MNYCIRVHEHLDQSWSSWFEGLSISWDTDGSTILSGPLQDQSALYGLINKLRDLGLSLIAVVPGRAGAAATRRPPGRPARRRGRSRTRRWVRRRN